MPKDAKYGQLNIPHIPDDEPIIVLRAQDVFAVAALKHYFIAASGACDKIHLDLIRKTTDAFIAWPTKKIPDTTSDQLK